MIMGTYLLCLYYRDSWKASLRISLLICDFMALIYPNFSDISVCSASQNSYLGFKSS